jgi:hypothetical protein
MHCTALHDAQYWPHYGATTRSAWQVGKHTRLVRPQLSRAPVATVVYTAHCTLKITVLYTEAFGALVRRYIYLSIYLYYPTLHYPIYTTLYTEVQYTSTVYPCTKVK